MRSFFDAGQSQASDLEIGSDPEANDASLDSDTSQFKPVLYGHARLRAIPPWRWLAFGVSYLGVPVVIPADLNDDDTFHRLTEIIADTSPTSADIAVL